MCMCDVSVDVYMSTQGLVRGVAEDDMEISVYDVGTWWSEQRY